LTDEKKKKKKSSKTTKNEADEHKDTENVVSSSRLQTDRSSKSLRSLFQVFTPRSTESKTSSVNESASESHVDSPSVPAATNALSVTARWGLNWRLTDTQAFTSTGSYNTTLKSMMESDDVGEEDVADKLAKENMLQNHGKKDKRRPVKLCESLDASVLRNVLVCQNDASNNPESEGRKSTAASNQDLSHMPPEVPPLTLQSDVESRRSSLNMKLVVLALLHIHKI